MTNFDILCLSSSSWGERVRRPQHLMRVASRHHRVVVVEQAANLTEDAPLIPVAHGGPPGIKVLRPADRWWTMSRPRVRTSIRTILGGADPSHLALWLEHPRSLGLLPARVPHAVVCDLREPAVSGSDVLDRADLLLMDGASGYEATRRLHPRTYLFPHAVDLEHFGRARTRHREPPDQAAIPGPRVGFWGALDDRIDFDLVEALAARMPHVHFVMIGPMMRIGRERAGSRANLHWLGTRAYADLPDYAGGWSAAILPFALNDATRYLSPPQIPEFLAAGRTIVSTPLRDAMHPYGASGLVRIAETLDGFVSALESSFRGQSVDWLNTLDRYLRALSWESSWEGIEHLVNRAILRRSAPVPVERHPERIGSLAAASVLH